LVIAVKLLSPRIVWVPQRDSLNLKFILIQEFRILKSWLDWLKAHGVATSAGGKYKINPPSEKQVTLSVPEFVEKVNTDAAFKDSIYNIIADDYIMAYRDPNSVLLLMTL
jgi:hypothetical protein